MGEAENIISYFALREIQIQEQRENKIQILSKKTQTVYSLNYIFFIVNAIIKFINAFEWKDTAMLSSLLLVLNIPRHKQLLVSSSHNRIN